MNATSSGNDRYSGTSRSNDPLVIPSLYSRMRGGMIDQATPRAFLPVYARRWHAYCNPTVAIVATKGWDTDGR